MSRILLTASVALLVSAVGASSAGAAYPAGCINPADSALNQYCEVLPAPTGGQTPRAGMPAVASTLPGRTALRIARSSRFRALLTLPAGPHRAVLGEVGNQSPLAGEVSNGSPFPGWLIAALAGSALLLVGGAAAGWRTRRRAGLSHQTSP